MNHRVTGIVIDSLIIACNKCAIDLTFPDDGRDFPAFRFARGQQA
jgi:hypothetical protein